MPFTLGFVDDYALLEHFYEHGMDFNAADEYEYLRLADSFLGGPRNKGTLECYRTMRDGTRGDKIRYNRTTEEYGVLGNDNVIRTYYVPDPAIHGRPNNLEYFRAECKKIKG